MTTHIGLVGGGNITVTHARAARAISGVEISAIHGTPRKASPRPLTACTSLRKNRSKSVPHAPTPSSKPQNNPKSSSA